MEFELSKRSVACQKLRRLHEVGELHAEEFTIRDVGSWIVVSDVDEDLLCEIEKDRWFREWLVVGWQRSRHLDDEEVGGGGPEGGDDAVGSGHVG